MQSLDLVATPLTRNSIVIRVKTGDVDLAKLAQQRGLALGQFVAAAIVAFCCAPAEPPAPPPVIAAPVPAPAEEVIVRRVIQAVSLSPHQAARLRTELWRALK